MWQVSYIAKENEFKRNLITTLQDFAQYNVSSISPVKLGAQQPLLSSANIIIVDFAQLSLQIEHVLDDICRLNASATIILLVPTENVLQTEKYLHLGADEVFELPRSEKQTDFTLKQILSRIDAFQDLSSLQQQLKKKMRLRQIVAKSKAMLEIMRYLPQIASSTATVLMTGETGTGKELIARAIHYLGNRADKPFVPVDCGAIPENLAENELFGHVRGAYTDAQHSTTGLIQEADGGTLFLDEIESLPIPVQSKFLRFLQERQFKPLGQTKYLSIDVRVLAATNADLLQAVQKRMFRQDLYYRLNVIPLFIPPLRKRRADIPPLIEYFLNGLTSNKKLAARIRPLILRKWQNYSWPGNVRELENKVNEYFIFQQNELDRLPSYISETEPSVIRLLAEVRKEAQNECEQKYLFHLMRFTDGNISAGARLAGVHRKSLGKLLKKHGINASDYRNGITDFVDS